MKISYFLQKPAKKQGFKICPRMVTLGSRLMVYFLVPCGTKETTCLTEKLISFYIQEEKRKKAERENIIFRERLLSAACPII